MKFRSLTTFQAVAEEMLGKVIEKLDSDVVYRSLEGVTETYIKLVLAKDIQVWIYEDGAQIRTRDQDYRFEKEDFLTEGELLKAFFAEVAKAVSSE